ncbi:MAG: ABC transporter ATP-binding protein [Anaerolineales bacterium]|jgi:lipopolysaccharide transport system ATP-binding protein
MMTSITISVKNLSKRYRIGLEEEIQDTFAEAFFSTLRSPIKNLKQLRRLSHFRENSNKPDDIIWALKDIGFKVEKGEIIGIIGRNGAGKTTLLKILSKITFPTTGRVELRGRVASLLEVGTGFHGELSGRDNVYLNGTILGMTKKEIDRKFNEIVDFSGVEKFIDTPVKRYSSGMRVRLAFSVAAHLEPEILLIDEVLAVGDAAFQRKCLGKMGEVAASGRTVLFVSHNMDAVEKLCPRVMLINEGQLIYDGNEVRRIIDQYLSIGLTDRYAVWVNSGNQFDNRWFTPIKVTLLDKDEKVLDAPVQNDQNIFLKIEGFVQEVNRDLTIGYYCYSENSNYPVFLSQFNDGPFKEWPEIHIGHNTLITNIPAQLFNTGVYSIKPYIILRSGQNASSKVRIVNPDTNELVLSFTISGVVNNSPNWINRKGVIAPILPWKNCSTEILEGK